MHHSRRVQALVIQRVTKRLQLFLRHPLERRIQDQRGGVSSWTGTLIVSARRPCYRPAIVTSSKTAIISLKIRQRRPPLRSSLRAASLSQEIRDQWYRDVERDQKVEDKKAG